MKKANTILAALIVIAVITFLAIAMPEVAHNFLNDLANAR